MYHFYERINGDDDDDTLIS